MTWEQYKRLIRWDASLWSLRGGKKEREGEKGGRRECKFCLQDKCNCLVRSRHALSSLLRKRGREEEMSSRGSTTASSWTTNCVRRRGEIYTCKGSYSRQKHTTQHTRTYIGSNMCMCVLCSSLLCKNTRTAHAVSLFEMSI